MSYTETPSGSRKYTCDGVGCNASLTIYANSGNRYATVSASQELNELFEAQWTIDNTTSLFGKHYCPQHSKESK